MDRPGPTLIEVLDLLTNEVRSFGSGLAVQASPSGSVLAVPGGGALYWYDGLVGVDIVATGTADRRSLPVSVLAEAGIGWSPDSSRIAFVTTINGQRVVETARASDSGGIVQVAVDSAAEHPSYSPDSKTIFFSTTRDGDGAIFAAPADGTAPTSPRRISPPGSADARPSSGIAADPAADGYWLVGASDSRIFDFGNTCPVSTGANGRLSQPVVGAAGDPSTSELWAVASDGGVFTAGGSSFYGSMGGQHLNSPIVGIAATATGLGYWLTASDGGIFTFGDATFFGSTGAIRLAQPIVAMAATGDGKGYWLLGADGGIFTFGNAPYMGAIGWPSANPSRASFGTPPRSDLRHTSPLHRGEDAKGRTKP